MKIAQRFQEKNHLEDRIKSIKSEISTFNLAQLTVQAGEARSRYESFFARLGQQPSEQKRQELARLKGAMDAAGEKYAIEKEKDARLRKELSETMAALDNLDPVCSESELKALDKEIINTKQKISDIIAALDKQEAEEAAIGNQLAAIGVMERQLDELLADKALGADCQNEIIPLEEKIKAANDELEGTGSPDSIARALEQKLEQAKRELATLNGRYGYALNGYLVGLALGAFQEYQAATNNIEKSLSRIYALGALQEQVGGKAGISDPIIKSFFPVVIPAVCNLGNLFDSDKLDRAQAIADEKERILSKGVTL